MRNNPYTYYGLYGFRPLTANEKFNPRKSLKSLRTTRVKGPKESDYIHDICIEAINHVSLFWEKNGIHYGELNSCKFVPINESDSDSSNIIQKMIDISYGESTSKEIPWKQIHLMRSLQYRGYSPEFSESFMNDLAQHAESLDMPTLQGIIDDESFKVLQLDKHSTSVRTCNKIEQLSTQRPNVPSKDVLLQTELIQLGKQFLLGDNALVGEYYGNKKVLVNPYPLDKNFNSVLGYNVALNKASLTCHIMNSECDFPARFILNMEPTQILHKNASTYILNKKLVYKGFFIIRFSLDDDPEITINAIGCEKLGNTSHDKPHKSVANYYVFFVFERTGVRDMSVTDKFMLINFRCNVVDWGDVSDSKKILYSEIRQVMCLHAQQKLKMYLITSTKKDTLSTKYEKWIHEEDLRKLVSQDKTLPDNVHVVVSKPDISPQLIYGDYTLEPCFFTYDLDRHGDRLMIRLLDTDDFPKLSEDEYCVSTNCLQVRDIYQRLKIQSILNIKSQDIGEVLVPQPIQSRLLDSVKSVVSSYAPQVGSGKKKTMFELFKTQIRVLKRNAHLNEKIDNNNDMFYSRVLKQRNVTYTHQENKLFVNKVEEPYFYNFIKPKTIHLLQFAKSLVPGEILILGSNIHFAELALDVYKSIKVTLIVMNVFEVYSFIALKKKFGDRVTIHMCGFVNIDTLVILDKLCQKKTFSTIIIDFGVLDESKELLITLLGIMVCNKYLAKSGTFMKYCILPLDWNSPVFYACNELCNSFQHINYESNRMSFSFDNSFVYVLKNFKPLDSNMEHFYYNTYQEFFVEPQATINKITTYFKSRQLNIFHLQWLTLLLNNANTMLKIMSREQEGAGIGRLYYHLFQIKSVPYKVIPRLVKDIPDKFNYNEDARDFQTRCHWGQKKLLLTEIQFLTQVCKKVKSLSEYTIVYIGSADGRHFPIVYNMFPGLVWLLYDPNKFSKGVMNHPDINKSIFVYNMFFTDETISHVKSHSKSRKILFISDIRVMPSEEAVMVDMINQAKWSMALGADFMMFKFRLPYTTKENPVIPKTIKDLRIDSKLVANPNIIAQKDEMLYLKGDMFLQVYPPIHSTEVRLHVEKSRDGKYELATYNYKDIEEKMFYYNTYMRGVNDVDDAKNNIYDLEYIPGYDTSLECLMEYNIINDYLRVVKGIKVKDLHRACISFMFDTNLTLERLSYAKFVLCNEMTSDKTFSKFSHDVDKKSRLYVWKQLSTLLTHASIRLQTKMLMRNGDNVLGVDRTRVALQQLRQVPTSMEYFSLVVGSHSQKSTQSKPKKNTSL